MRKKLIAGNWKMHGGLASNKQLLDEILSGIKEMQEVEVDFAVCVPYPYLSSVKSMLQNTNISWGAQDISQYEKGAYTGEVSGSMLNDFGCRYVIVGHSERRALFGESSDIVAEKYLAAQKSRIIPILCVGETLEQREAGITEQIIRDQLAPVIELAGIESFNQAVIAYEPVWAIGTGKTASPKQAQDVHVFIRSIIAQLSTQVAERLIILYGGSVKANNAAELFAISGIDGGLIGGASLIADDFIAICKAAVHH